MEEPKNLEELNKIIKKQENNRKQEYGWRKWLFLFTDFSWGIGTFPDLIKKDKIFWILAPFLLILLGIVLLIISKSFT